MKREDLTRRAGLLVAHDDAVEHVAQGARGLVVDGGRSLEDAAEEPAGSVDAEEADGHALLLAAHGLWLALWRMRARLVRLAPLAAGVAWALATPAPDLLVCVVDATNLRLHLRFVLEVRALGRPMMVAINRMDVARRQGLQIDLAQLSQRLGVPVVGTVAVQRDGAATLSAALQALPSAVSARSQVSTSPRCSSGRVLTSISGSPKSNTR